MLADISGCSAHLPQPDLEGCLPFFRFQQPFLQLL
jgi:hypothetical protein